MADVQIINPGCDDDDDDGKRGKRGHRGHDGPTGSTGPTGPTGLGSRTELISPWSGTSELLPTARGWRVGRSTTSSESSLVDPGNDQCR